MATRHELNPVGIIAFCDDLRTRAPKQTALAVRYFLEVATQPSQPAKHYHKVVVGEENYSHGNAVIRGLFALKYLAIRQSNEHGEDIIDLNQEWKKKILVKPVIDKITRSNSAMNVVLTVDSENDVIRLTSPYHPDMPRLAKAAGGKWTREAWVFPLSRESEVKDLCMDIYGENGTRQPRVNVRCQATPSLMGEESASLFLAGRRIVSAKSVDDGLTLGDGVAIIEGGFERAEKNGKTVVIAREGTVFEIRNLPEVAATRLQQAHSIDVERISAPEIVDAPCSARQAPRKGPAPPVEAEAMISLRESLQEAREEILRLCETHGLPWPEESLAKYQRAIDRARAAEIARGK